MNGPLFQDLFHGNCDCFLENNLLPDSTCGFCRHLNFKHLFNCVFRYDKIRYHCEKDRLNECPNICTDWYCKEGLLNKCLVCRLVATEFGHESISEVLLLVRENWSQDSPPVLCFRGGEESQHEIAFRVSTHSWPQIGSKVDWNRIRTWPLSQSEYRTRFLPISTRRSSRSSFALEDLLDTFRVMDMARNCIVCPEYPVDYVALSYVWGRTSENEFQATLRNIEGLELEGSLSQIQIPRTIQDAMFVCRQLGQRYLWVDRFCILQDDEDSKHGQIAAMDRIFGTAVFTIVALTGSDSQSGLAGVSRLRHTRLKTLEWPGFNLIEDPPLLKDLVQKSTWGKRGWTFQEELFSNIILYFTDHGVYQSSYILPHHSLGGTNSECYFHPTQWAGTRENTIGSLKIIEKYTTRSLSFQDDILRACTGVLNCFRGSHYFGIPFDEFAAGIHWQPVDWTHERRTSLTEVFPSWSWSSAHGPVKFESLIIFVSLWAFPTPSKPGEHEALEWISDHNPLKSLDDVEIPSILEDFPSTSSLSVFEEHDRKRAHERPGRLLVFTQVTTFGIRNMHNLFSDGRRTFSIRSFQGKHVGDIWLTAPSSEDIKGDNDVPRKEPFEFLALGCEIADFYMGTGQDDLLSSMEQMMDDKRLDRTAIIPLVAMFVMLILRDEVSGVVRRLGTGKVFMEAWLKAKPEFKTIVLE